MNLVTACTACLAIGYIIGRVTTRKASQGQIGAAFKSGVEHERMMRLFRDAEAVRYVDYSEYHPRIEA